MGGEATKKSLLWGVFYDAGRAPERVTRSDKEEGEGGGGGQEGAPNGGEDIGRFQQDRGGGDGGEQGRHTYGGIQLGYEDGVWGGATVGGGHVAGSGPDSQGGK